MTDASRTDVEGTPPADLDTDATGVDEQPGGIRRRFQRFRRIPGVQRLALFRGVPRLVWLVVAVQTLFLVVTSIIYPVFQSPDEVAHVDYVVAHRHGQWLDGPGQRHWQSGIIRAWQEVPNTQGALPVGNTSPLPRSDRESFDELGTSTLPDNLPNQMVQHPPLYYGLGAAWTYLMPDYSGQRFDIQVYWLRLLSILLFLPLPILAWRIGRALSGSDSVGLTAAILPWAIPSYLRSGSAVTNDALLILLSTSLLYFLAKVLRGDLTRRTAAWVGVLWGLALLTKGFALLAPVPIALAYLVGARGSLLRRIRSAAPPAILGLAVGFVIGGWWWIRNEILYGVVQPNGYGPMGTVNRLHGPDHAGGTNHEMVRIFLQELGTRLFGSLGLVDSPRMPYRLMITMSVTFVVLVALGVLIGMRRAPSPRWAAFTLVVPTLCALAISYFGTRGVYFQTRRVEGIQIRYYVPYLVGLTVCIGVALGWLARAIRRWVPAAILGLVIVFDVAAAVWVLDKEMGPSRPTLRGRVAGGVHYVMDWAPWPPIVTVVLVVLMATATLLLLAALVYRAARPPQATATGESDELPRPRRLDRQALPASG
jgi:4-amino-4-deoxy-L-arabinose transferase-like glycosyltransferase